MNKDITKILFKSNCVKIDIDIIEQNIKEVESYMYFGQKNKTN